MNGIPELDAAGLRKFALTMAGLIAAIFGLVLPVIMKSGMPVWPWLLAGIFFLWGITVPVTLRPVYQCWMRFGLLLHKITTPVVLAVVFFFVIVPAGWIMKLFKSSQIKLDYDESITTYKIKNKQLPDEDMKRPF